MGKFRKETYKITGMNCVSCVKTIERVMLEAIGVRSAAVNFASESVQVEFDGNAISPGEIGEVVASVGYTLDVGE